MGQSERLDTRRSSISEAVWHKFSLLTPHSDYKDSGVSKYVSYSCWASSGSPWTRWECWPVPGTLWWLRQRWRIQICKDQPEASLQPPLFLQASPCPWDIPLTLYRNISTAALSHLSVLSADHLIAANIQRNTSTSWSPCSNHLRPRLTMAQRTLPN